MALPPAQQLIDLVRSDGPDALDAYPDVEEYASTEEAASYLGLSPGTIRREQWRKRSDGRTWPRPDRMFGRAAAWKYRTVILYRASQPGPGNRAGTSRRPRNEQAPQA